MTTGPTASGKTGRTTDYRHGSAGAISSGHVRDVRNLLGRGGPVVPLSRAGATP